MLRSSGRKRSNLSGRRRGRRSTIDGGDTASHEFGTCAWITVQSLEQVKSLVRQLMQENGKDILLSFDFDGCLSGRRTKRTYITPAGPTKTQAEVRREQVERMADQLAQESLSVELLTWLNDQDIPYIINSAASNPCRPRSQMGARNHQSQFPEEQDVARVQRAGMPCSTRVLRLLNAESQTSDNPQAQQYQQGDALVQVCENCVFSAGYEKHAAILQAIEMFQWKPKVIVHVDDGAVNLETVIRQLCPAYRVIGVFYPTVEGTVMGDEPNQEESLAFLEASVTKL